MQKNDAGSEVAMDSYGRMFVLDKDGKLSKISPNEYDNTKHHAISNSELLQYRERVAGMDGNLLNAMDDLVGKQDVYKAVYFNDPLPNDAFTPSSYPSVYLVICFSV